MAQEMLPERCVDHRVQEAEILSRLERLEEDIRSLQDSLKGKVDANVLQEIVERRTKEIEELKASIRKLSAADAKHSEALAGILAVLQGFKETQDLMREDYKKLTDCYTQTSVHIAAISTTLAERARREDSEVKEEAKEESEEKKGPWYVRILDNKVILASLVATLFVILTLIVTNIEEVLILLGQIFK